MMEQGMKSMEHRGHFAILKTKTEQPDHTSIELKDGWILSYHKIVNVYYNKDNDFLLLGYAWQALPGLKSPREVIDSFSGDEKESDILAAEETWVGRYVLIHDGTVYLDACSMFPVFYSDDGISSDTAWLAKARGLEEKLYHPREGYVMNWMPGPLTQYDGIYKLLPSRIYDYKRKELRSRQLLAQSYKGIADEEERIAVFSEYFKASLENMQKLFPGKKFLVALTGGYDSRTLFALAKYAGMDFDAYTLEYDGIYEDDISTPKTLCQKADIRHRYVPRDKSRYSKEREEEYLHHTAGLIYDEDRLFYAYGQFQDIMEEYRDVVFLRSSIWENVIEYFRRSFVDDGPGEDFYDWFGAREGSREKLSLEQYFAWHKEHPQDKLVASNIFLWEQREGCWLSTIESGFDLIENAITLQPVNCRYFLTMLLEFPRNERLMKYHQAKIIRYVCPEIGDVPYGTEKRSQESALSVFSAKLKRGFMRLSTLGIKKTWKTYMSMLHKKKEIKELERQFQEDEKKQKKNK